MDSYICEHNNLIAPRMRKAFYSMPDSFYKLVAATLSAKNTSTQCAFELYRPLLERRAAELDKKKS